MVLSMLPKQFSSHPWGILPSSACGFVCPVGRSSVAMTPLRLSPSDDSRLRGAKKNYSAEWIDLLSPDSYASPSASLPGRIDPPRSGAVSVSTPAGDRLVTFAGYAEVASAAEGTPPERFVVNDLWEFAPFRESATSDESPPWGWTKVPPSEEGYVPGPRLATALASLPSLDDDKSHAVLLGGWDPQTPGTGGVILDDVSMLDLESLEWSPCADAADDEKASTVPDGPTSRHVAVPLSIERPGGDGVRNVVCLHNHRCEDHVLLLSATDGDGNKMCAKWERQTTTGDVPSSRGLHCAAPLANADDATSKAMVMFGGAAKDGNMSNEAFVLDANAWRWTKLDCGGNGDDAVPAPRAGACLCPLDENSVLLFGGATPGDGGLLGLNDVWVLHVDVEQGKGKWECLVRDRSDAEDGVVRPPGRNAATLSAIDAEKFLPNVKAVADGDEKGACFLLQGGWYPFRETYNDIFLLRVTASSS